MRFLALTAALCFWTQTSICAAGAFGVGRPMDRPSGTSDAAVHVHAQAHEHGPHGSGDGWLGAGASGGSVPARCPFCPGGSHPAGDDHCELMCLAAATAAPPSGWSPARQGYEPSLPLALVRLDAVAPLARSLQAPATPGASLLLLHATLLL